jgi:hypothetical protein
MEGNSFFTHESLIAHITPDFFDELSDFDLKEMTGSTTDMGNQDESRDPAP